MNLFRHNRHAATPVAALALTAVFAAGLATMGTTRNAQAYPAYSKKEGKPCSYCHVNPQGGGKRNAAGLYYKEHSLSLVGFTPAGGTPVAASPTPKPAVKATPKATKAPAKTKKPAKKPAPAKVAAKKAVA